MRHAAHAPRMQRTHAGTNLRESRAHRNHLITRRRLTLTSRNPNSEHLAVRHERTPSQKSIVLHACVSHAMQHGPKSSEFNYVLHDRRVRCAKIVQHMRRRRLQIWKHAHVVLLRNVGTALRRP